MGIWQYDAQSQKLIGHVNGNLEVAEEHTCLLIAGNGFVGSFTDNLIVIGEVRIISSTHEKDITFVCSVKDVCLLVSIDDDTTDISSRFCRACISSDTRQINAVAALCDGIITELHINSLATIKTTTINILGQRDIRQQLDGLSVLNGIKSISEREITSHVLTVNNLNLTRYTFVGITTV